jgi:tRNA-dihydrouridine synthase A
MLHTLCIAPMMAHTDRHFRYLMRLISRRVMLYTEMITTGALLHGNAAARLAFDVTEHPVGIQIGGAVPGELARCAQLAEAAGFDEVNLNVGCPSGRVSGGGFGACLMAKPELVAECVSAMAGSVRIPATVKTRIGIDDRDSFEDLCAFVTAVSDAGCGTFIVHARKAWLDGLSPRQNRSVPPLRHDMVQRLKREFPHLEIIANGGIGSLDAVEAQLEHVDGVMIGRAACRDPWLLADADRRIFGEPCGAPERLQVLAQYLHYAERRLREGASRQLLLRPVLGLFQGRPGARAFRRRLSTPDAGVDAIRKELEMLEAA